MKAIRWFNRNWNWMSPIFWWHRKTAVLTVKSSWRGYGQWDDEVLGVGDTFVVNDAEGELFSIDFERKGVIRVRGYRSDRED